MSHAVEGNQFKNFTFKMLTPDDYPAIRDLMEISFCSDEPVLKLAGVTQKDFDDFQKLYDGVIEHNLSFAAYDNQSGRMAGVRLMCFNRSADKEKYEATQRSIQSKNVRISQKFLRQSESDCGDICGRFKVKSEDCANLCRTTVHVDFRGQGLATEMYKRALALLKDSGFLLAKTIFTNPHSRKAALKFGFEELGRLPFNRMEDLDGKLICPDCGDDEFASVMAVKL